MEQEVNVQLNNFDGPLDLLLSLVKDKQMDIFDIDLAELATSYLNLIKNLKNQNIDLAGEYLVMAATLIQLKSRMLLIDPDQKEEVEKEKEDILNKLAEYQQFKKISQKLREKETIRKNIFIKDTDPYENFQYEIDESRLDGSSDAIKLIIALRKMFERTNAKSLREAKIEKFNLSPAQRRLEIIKILKTNGTPTFEELFTLPSMNHFVLTMVTILDMSRKQEIILEQNHQYDEIKFRKGNIYD